MEERPTLQLRLATLTDASEIACLSAQLGYPVSDAEMDRRLEALLETPGRRCWVADPGDGLVVDDKARRRGVGRFLVEQIECWAKSGNHLVLGVSSNVLRDSKSAIFTEIIKFTA